MNTHDYSFGTNKKVNKAMFLIFCRISCILDIVSYCGGWISLTLKFLISTLVAPSHLNVAMGPPQVIIWSGAPPHSSDSLPKPPESVNVYTFSQLFFRVGLS